MIIKILRMSIWYNILEFIDDFGRNFITGVGQFGSLITLETCTGEMMMSPFV